MKIKSDSPENVYVPGTGLSFSTDYSQSYFLTGYDWAYQPVQWPFSVPADVVLFGVQVPAGASGKKLLTNAGDLRDTGSSPGWGRSPEEGNGNPLQSSCLENPMDRGANSP